MTKHTPTASNVLGQQQRAPTTTTEGSHSYLVVSDEIFETKMRLSRAEVWRDESEERCDAFVDSLINVLGLKIS